MCCLCGSPNYSLFTTQLALKHKRAEQLKLQYEKSEAMRRGMLEAMVKEKDNSIEASAQRKVRVALLRLALLRVALLRAAWAGRLAN